MTIEYYMIVDNIAYDAFIDMCAELSARHIFVKWKNDDTIIFDSKEVATEMKLRYL